MAERKPKERRQEEARDKILTSPQELPPVTYFLQLDPIS
jgi:hypothetical protein